MSARHQVFKVRLRGDTLLTSPRFNKGTAFTLAERKRFGLTGRLPFRVNSLDEQCARAYDQLKDHESDLRKNAFLQSLKTQNWVLYYALIGRHLRELMPIIYTPTEADAIANYSHLFRRSEGLYLTFPNADSMEEDYLEATRGRNLDLIVCSDAEQILGIGDQGVGGIGISTAKSAVYTLIAGIDPSRALSITLDVGTNNEDLLKDHLYVGWPEKRVRGEEYDQFIDKFVQLVRKHHPHCLLHFEDFGVENAYRLLQRYHDQHAVFNDDVQGTGAVTLAALMSAVGVTKSKLADQRIIIFGAGTAGLGIARQLRDAMAETDNIPKSEANKRFWLVDKYGLIHEGMKEGTIRGEQKEFARPDAELQQNSDSIGEKNENDSVGLLGAVKIAKPTIMIGCSTKGGAFSEDVVREMGKHCERPIILPLSNPSRLVEVKPSDANEWTEGRALMATGSPFEPVKMPNGKDYIIAECNNALIYPGLGLGAILSRSRILTDTMIIAGARRLASLSPALHDPDDALLPDFGESPQVNKEVAVAVVMQAIIEGSADDEVVKELGGGDGREVKEEAVRRKVDEVVWKPFYGEYVYDEEGDS